MSRTGQQLMLRSERDILHIHGPYRGEVIPMSVGWTQNTTSVETDQEVNEGRLYALGM